MIAASATERITAPQEIPNTRAISEAYSISLLTDFTKITDARIVFCIRNSFTISLTEKMKLYGRLASVGTTSKVLLSLSISISSS